jgi:uncharacterized alkaline shock family protein YloU
LEVIALVGPSGTGKSHRAVVVAHQFDAQAIIDDGLLIQGNRILAGTSAKRQPTRIGAIKAALFMDDLQTAEVKKALEGIGGGKILILGTSDGMVLRIAERLALPAPAKMVKIEDVASSKEIEKAKYMRHNYSKHVIPAPTLEVKKSLPGAIVAPIKVFLRRKEGKEQSAKKDWLEQSVLRPTFTYHGRLSIANSALSAIAEHVAASVKGVNDPGRTSVVPEQEGIVIIELSPSIVYGYPLHEVAGNIQKKVKRTVEDMTGLLVKEVNVQIRNLSFAKEKSEAN